MSDLSKISDSNSITPQKPGGFIFKTCVRATFLQSLCNSITRQAIELESVQTLKSLTSSFIQEVRKKQLESHVDLHGNTSAPVQVTDLVEVSKDVASLQITLKKTFCLGVCSFFVRDVISGGLFGHLGQLHLVLGANRQMVVFR